MGATPPRGAPLKRPPTGTIKGFWGRRGRVIENRWGQLRVAAGALRDRELAFKRRAEGVQPFGFDIDVLGGNRRLLGGSSLAEGTLVGGGIRSGAPTTGKDQK
jgi:hypothetical protein